MDALASQGDEGLLEQAAEGRRAGRAPDGLGAHDGWPAMGDGSANLGRSQQESETGKRSTLAWPRSKS
eukprot:13798990-Alexandrium_andersonii.AAC.1